METLKRNTVRARTMLSDQTRQELTDILELLLEELNKFNTDDTADGKITLL